jgi:hypothetical protein
MIAERVHAGLARARGEGKRLGRPPSPPHSKNESVRLWRLLERPVCASLPNSLGLTPARCSGSAALSSRTRSRCEARQTVAAGGLIQNDSGLPQGPAGTSGHPETAVSWHSGFRGGAHARPKATPVHHALERGSPGGGAHLTGLWAAAGASDGLGFVVSRRPLRSPLHRATTPQQNPVCTSLGQLGSGLAAKALTRVGSANRQGGDRQWRAVP